MREPYSVLNLSCRANSKAIKAAYGALANSLIPTRRWRLGERCIGAEMAEC